MSLSARIIYCYSEAMASILTDRAFNETVDNRIFSLRYEAIQWVQQLAEQLVQRQYTAIIVEKIIEQKLIFAKSLLTTNDFEELKKCSAPKWNYSGYRQSGKYYIPEEELLFWSMLSARCPLNSEQSKRWEQVVRETTVIPKEFLSELGLLKEADTDGC